MSLGDTIALLLQQNGARFAYGTVTQSTQEQSVDTGLAQVDFAFVSFRENRHSLHWHETAKPDPAVDSAILVKSWRAAVANPVDLSSLLGHSGGANDIVWLAIGK